MDLPEKDHIANSFIYVKEYKSDEWSCKLV